MSEGCLGQWRYLRTVCGALEPPGGTRASGLDRPSEGYITHARQQISDPRARFDIGDVQSLPGEAGSYDAVVAGLVLNFVPEPRAAAAEMARVTRPGGVVAAYVWDYAGQMQLMRHFWDAAAALYPEALDLDEGRRFPMCQPDPLARLFQEATLKDVEVRGIAIPTHFRDFDDYWSPFLGGQGPAPGFAMALTEGRRTALRERIRAALPIRTDGSIRLSARAWAVRGVRRPS